MVKLRVVGPAALLASLGAGAACGRGEPALRLLAPTPWALACLAAPAEATLHVEGHATCALTTDGAGVATGSCDSISTGAVLAVAVLYRWPRAALALHVDAIDLRPEAVSHDAIEIHFTAAELITSPAALAGPVDPAKPQERARLWARSAVLSPDDQLDVDGDGVPNLVEACQGLLTP